MARGSVAILRIVKVGTGHVLYSARTHPLPRRVEGPKHANSRVRRSEAEGVFGWEGAFSFARAAQINGESLASKESRVAWDMPFGPGSDPESTQLGGCPR